MSESYVDKTNQSGFDSANRNLCEGANSGKKKRNVTFPITVKKICLCLILGESRPWYLL